MGQIFYVRFAPRHYGKIKIMKGRKMTIKLIGNDNIAPEEEQKIWDTIFNLLLQKSNPKKQKEESSENH